MKSKILAAAMVGFCLLVVDATVSEALSKNDYELIDLGELSPSATSLGLLLKATHWKMFWRTYEKRLSFIWKPQILQSCIYPPIRRS